MNLADVTDAQFATVGGGLVNAAAESFATVAGGLENQATGEASSVGGGWANIASAFAATVPGGLNNHATGVYSAAFGSGNRAGGSYSIAVGFSAYALHNGSFVFSDFSSFNPTNTGHPNQFIARALGGVYFFTGGTNDLTQAFHAAFGLGPSDKQIVTVDADGVALAAIQGLNAKLEAGLAAKTQEIAELRAELTDLRAVRDEVARMRAELRR